MVVYAGHALAYQLPAVGHVALLLQTVEHGVERALLGGQFAAAGALGLLHQLVAVHILALQQRQDHQRHDAAAVVALRGFPHNRSLL